jgi:hypothetical protein
LTGKIKNPTSLTIKSGSNIKQSSRPRLSIWLPTSKTTRGKKRTHCATCDTNSNNSRIPIGIWNGVRYESLKVQRHCWWNRRWSACYPRKTPRFGPIEPLGRMPSAIILDMARVSFPNPLQCWRILSRFGIAITPADQRPLERTVCRPYAQGRRHAAFFRPNMSANLYTFLNMEIESSPDGFSC